MAVSVMSIKCPNCGDTVTIEQKTCDSCHQPVIITTFNSVASMPPLMVNKYASAYKKELAQDPESTELNTSIAMCYLKLKMYDEAYRAFSKAIVDNFDNSETYFYAAISLLKGKKAFVTPRADIDKIIELVNAANMIEPKGIYYYFLAYIKEDFFARKALRTTPTYQELLSAARATGLSATDVSQLYALLGVERPSVL